MSRPLVNRYLSNIEKLNQYEVAFKFSEKAKKLYPDDDFRYVVLLKLASSDMDSDSPFMNSFRDAVNQLLPPNTAMAPTTSATSATSATGSPNRYS